VSHEDEVVLLDRQARPIGTSGKLAAHTAPGAAHLAFSVLLHDQHDRVLLQRRAEVKHHFRGRWANTCCSHPRPGEPLLDACWRRLQQELRLDARPDLEVVGAFWYEATDRVSGLIEVEYDVVVVGAIPAGASVEPDPAEIADLRWVARPVAAELAASDHGAPWLAHVLRVAAAPAPEQVRLPAS
jgi:isopentenyl-diphosphate delta-isomerase